MMSKANTVLVLDLDDTLYSEIDYVYSGIKHLAHLLHQLTGVEIESQLLSFHRSNPKGDFLEYAIKEFNLPDCTKESLLWSYRLHVPDIQLEEGVQKWLQKNISAFHAVAILTDGRVVTQRLKLQALGLRCIPVYISEEWGGIKPDPKRFLAIQDRWIDKHYVYVGDNTSKDFVTPNRLGWNSVALKDKGCNVYRQDTEDDSEFSPKHWIDYLQDLDELIVLTQSVN